MNTSHAIVSGFDFSEAIEMAELCKCVYDVFASTETRDIIATYALKRPGEWELLVPITDLASDSRCLIVKKRGTRQYAVVFRGTIITEQHGIDLTSVTFDKDDYLTTFEPMAGETRPPSVDVKVHCGWLRLFERIRWYLSLFFDAAFSGIVSAESLRSMLKGTEDERRMAFVVLDAAVTDRCGPGIWDQAANSLSQHLEGALHNGESLEEVPVQNLLKTAGERTAVGRDQMNVTATESNVFFAGHSLGAVLATLGALHFKRSWHTKKEHHGIKAYAIGSPKLGNKYFVRYFNSWLRGYSYRVENLLDPVIYTPIIYYPPHVFLQLLLPGVDYFHLGDKCYAFLEHAGEAIPVVGLGAQNVRLDWGGPLHFAWPMPFAHGIDGYIGSLRKYDELQEKMMAPFRNYISRMFRSQNEQIAHVMSRLQKVQQEIERGRVRH